MKYKICPLCNAHLDHGEACECKTNAETAVAKPREYESFAPPEPKYGPPPFSPEEWEGFCNGTLEPPPLQS